MYDFQRIFSLNFTSRFFDHLREVNGLAECLLSHQHLVKLQGMRCLFFDCTLGDEFTACMLLSVPNFTLTRPPQHLTPSLVPLSVACMECFQCIIITYHLSSSLLTECMANQNQNIHSLNSELKTHFKVVQISDGSYF